MVINTEMVLVCFKCDSVYIGIKFVNVKNIFFWGYLFIFVLECLIG